MRQTSSERPKSPEGLRQAIEKMDESARGSDIRFCRQVTGIDPNDWPDYDEPGY